MPDFLLKSLISLPRTQNRLPHAFTWGTRDARDGSDCPQIKQRKAGKDRLEKLRSAEGGKQVGCGGRQAAEGAAKVAAEGTVKIAAEGFSGSSASTVVTTALLSSSLMAGGGRVEGTGFGAEMADEGAIPGAEVLGCDRTVETVASGGRGAAASTERASATAVDVVAM
jgi:nucleotide-binding universal stress UspA family protein